MTQTVAQKLQGSSVAVSFSSAFFGFYHHAGVLKALVENGVTPAQVAGTSAGAIVAAMYGAGMSPDEICDALLTIKRKDFWDFQFPFTKTGFGWLAGKRFAAALSRMLPVHNFESCRIPVSLGVYRVRDGRSVQMQSGSLIQGVVASCAVPYLFQPVSIGGEIYWDGGFQEKTPLGLFAHTDIETIFVSHMPPREHRGGTAKKGLFANIAFTADTPPEERRERDRAAVRILREMGKSVIVFSPDRIWLGPFSLDKAEEAMTYGYEKACHALAQTDETALGSDELR
ncbi:MAG: patatin-like phospholipase family protein [Deltaproteobacteria bacterium]|nr:patatin-like phospholipase family protein [Deltaproteobacteria bacterium]MBN2673195.1 patatin-like phospholipase family protein [Deltaproteobacteria bacterium]